MACRDSILHYVLLAGQAAAHSRFLSFPYLSSFYLNFHRAPFLPVCAAEEHFECRPHIEVGWLLSPFPNVVIESCGLCQESDSFGYHHCVSVDLSPGMCKLLPLIQLLNETGGGFLWVVWDWSKGSNLEMMKASRGRRRKRPNKSSVKKKNARFPIVTSETGRKVKFSTRRQ